MTVPFGTGNMSGVNFAEVFTPPSVGAYNYGTANPAFALGQMAWGSDGSAWVYCKVGTGGITGSATLTATGYVVTFDEDFLAVMMSNSVGALGDKIGVASINSSAVINDYCWIQVYGVVDNIQTNGATAANTAIASTSTAGKIDDATTTGTKNISGLVLTTATGSAVAGPGVLNWPVIGSTN